MKSDTKDMEQRRPLTDENEDSIDVAGLLSCLLHSAGRIALASVLGACLAMLCVHVFVTPQYEATSKLYVSGGESPSSSLESLQAGAYLASDYLQIFSNWQMHEQVRASLNLDYSYDQLEQMVSAVNPENTRLLCITVRSADPDEARDMANAYAQAAQQFIASRMGQREPALFEEALYPEEPVSPSLLHGAAFGFCIGLFAACTWITLRFTAKG